MAYRYVRCKVCGGERTKFDVRRGAGLRCWPCRVDELRRQLGGGAGRRGDSRRDSERESRIAELHAAGYTLQEIGTVFGVSRERIRQILKRMGRTSADGGMRKRAAARNELIQAEKDENRNARAIRDFGCVWGELKALNDGLNPWAKGSKTRAFLMQRRNAIRRGVEWQMTFPEWIGLWVQSGKWSERGKGADRYVMARKQDFGPYAVWNVYITTNRQNTTDYQAELKKRGVMCSDGYRRLPEQANCIDHGESRHAA